MAFGGSLRNANSPSTNPTGIGGDANTIWHCDAETKDVYELSTTDLSTVRNADSPSTNPSGIGGDANTIWHCDSISDDVYELSTTDFSTVRNADSPSTFPFGIGGDANTIWHCDPRPDDIYELSTTDFSTVRNANSPYSAPNGIGGDANTIWHCDSISDDVYELSTTDFSTVRNADSPARNPFGIGGDANTIWHCDGYPDDVYELDAASNPNDLECEGATNPTGVTDLTPEFTAKLYSDDPGDSFDHVMIEVGTSKGAHDMWQSASIAITEVAFNIRCATVSYAGDALALDGTKYYWRIKAQNLDDEWTDWSTEEATFTMQVPNQAPSAPTSLECEEATNPTGVTDLTPEFTAVLSDPDSDDLTHVQILVNTTEAFDGVEMWDSGSVDIADCTSGNRCAAVSYAGTVLAQGGTKYYWKIRAYDGTVWGDYSAVANFTMATANTLSISDIVGLLDDVPQMLDIVPIADNIGLLETHISLGSFSVSDDVGLLSATSPNILEKITESLGLLVDIPQLLDIISITENLGLLESLPQMLDIISITESLDLLSTLSPDVVDKITESLGLLEAISPDIVEKITESLGLLSTLSTKMIESITDILGLLEALPQILDIISITDSLGLLETLSPDIVEKITESLGLLSTLSPDVVERITEKLGLLETLSSDIVGKITENLGLLESIPQMLDIISITENLGLLSEFHFTSFTQIEDIIGNLERLSYSGSTSIDDLLGLLEDWRRVGTVYVNVSEKIGLLESLTFKVEETIAEELGLEEAVVEAIYELIIYTILSILRYLTSTDALKYQTESSVLGYKTKTEVWNKKVRV